MLLTCRCFVQRYNEEMELEDAIHTALLTLREGFEGEVSSTVAGGGVYSVCPGFLCGRLQITVPCHLQMTAKNIEIGIVDTETGKFRVLTPEQVADYLEEAD